MAQLLGLGMWLSLEDVLNLLEHVVLYCCGKRLNWTISKLV
ncbi:MAG: hypothetical protein QGH52_04190 [Prochlorococcaceae cyanobacterium ETNP1_MAG_8]|nr:hypothetical protein [Prochlorococcaceae cyanobacterium ETNP1_MAG_8]